MIADLTGLATSAQVTATPPHAGLGDWGRRRRIRSPDTVSTPLDACLRSGAGRQRTGASRGRPRDQPSIGTQRWSPSSVEVLTVFAVISPTRIFPVSADS